MLLIKSKKNPIRGLFFVSVSLSLVVLLSTATSYIHYAINLPFILYTPLITSLALIPLSEKVDGLKTTYKYFNLKLFTLHGQLANHDVE